MIEIIHYHHKATEKPLEPSISEYYDEVRKLLPGLPETCQIYFGQRGTMPEDGVGGFAYADDVITISIDKGFKDKRKQRKALRPTIFHEAFHLYQHYTWQGRYSAIEITLYEGMATVFEREYAGVLEPYGDYQKTSSDKLRHWAEQLEQLGKFKDEESSNKWRFYHPELKERWIVYRTGTWMTDQVLQHHDLTILGLSTKTATDALKLYKKTI